MKAILFDCDGTLADSFGTIVSAMAETFRHHGRSVPAATDVHGVIGLSLEHAIADLLPVPERAEAGVMAGTYRAVFHEMRNDPRHREMLFEGVAEMLADLAGRDDVLLGIVTGKSRRGVAAIVAAHGLDGVFTAVRTADDCPSKPHPAMVLECCGAFGLDPADAVVVGDAVFDMQMARAAGSRGIGVAWGAGSANALEEAGATLVAREVAELRLLLDGFIETGALPQLARA
ncbi:HAD-IA family hydrolase [Aureimonas mangrovi]|uniref:HAD-IA family hydrolase n=1 Tax=Aureimonas mangrovi TaxID=2758041 RepID=UPI00163D64EC|nr:HAD-IA family hydrolase [Aureimonas mangrovi]